MPIFVRLEKYLFYFLFFAIPFQTRKILWYQSWSFNEWQAIFIYGTDIVLALLFVFWIFNKVKVEIRGYDYFLFILILCSVISLKNSSSYVLGLYNVLKLAEFVIFYFYLKNYAVYKFGISGAMKALVAGGLFQAFVAIVQFVKQSSLGLRLLGESVIGPDLVGIASFFNTKGEKIIRAYGTTPHPNVLATYLFLAIFSFYFIYFYFYKDKKHHWRNECLIWAGYLFLLFALFFTFARVVVFLWLAGFILRSLLVLFKDNIRKISFASEENKLKLLKILVSSIVAIVLFGALYWPEVLSRIKISSGEEAVQLRIFYNKESLQTLNWFGVGPGEFVNWLMIKEPNLSRNLYQPVHNIYLLIYSEIGIVGISAFILFLLFLIKDFVVSTKIDKLHHYSFLIIFLSLLFMGLFDHFLWTLQQGRFMFWLVCALLASTQHLTFVNNSAIITKSD